MIYFVICVISAGVFMVMGIWALVAFFKARDFGIGILLFITMIFSAVSFLSGLFEFNKCPDCGYMTDKKWCQECGAEIVFHCSGCGEEYPDEVPAFCPECGTDLKEASNAN